MTFLEAFGEVPDPRDYTARHPLAEVLFVAFAAVLCGATHCTEMALFARARLDLLRQFVPLSHGPPSHDTFSRVLNALDPIAFNAAFGRFMAAFGEAAGAAARHVAVDGKSLRRAYEKGASCMPPLVVTAFECETFMSLAQTVAGEGGEAEAAVRAVELLSLKGAIVTADALHCHKRMSEAVIAAGGDYVLAIKANQSKLAKAANAALDAARTDGQIRIHESVAQAHGRREVRRAFVIPFSAPPSKTDKALVGLRAVARIETERTVDGQDPVRTVRCFALSRRIKADDLLALVRSHWAIENHLHWQLDVLFREDDSRTRKKNGAANLALLRRCALNVLRSDPEDIPLSHKRLKARWSDHDLLLLMTHMR
jgi:predicted transposase YbfD/YdcC